ncbi:MAG: FAD-dependent monooxygenase [Pseudomonadota bacterium]
MRPAGRHQFESLYFDYPQFEVTRASELDGRSTEAPVAIVGAGPVGLLAAIDLARYGVRSVVLDDKTTINDGSRAICLARHSMETLQQLGLHDKFTDKALGWTSGRSYYRGVEVYRLHMPHSDTERFGPMYNLQQQYIEQYLLDAATETGLVEVRWGNRVASAEATADGARLEVESEHGRYVLHAQYCLAADGARSTVRRALELPLRGDAYEGKYVIADIRMKSDFPTERRAFFDPSANPGATLLIHKQPDDIWRIDWQLQAGESDEEALEEDNLRRKIAAILAMIGEEAPWDLEWWSIYKAYTLCLDNYRHGPFFFIGDAAHLVPIFGVRGLNSGIADAANVSWKLALVLNGDAPDALLDSYSTERRGATMEVFENAARSTAFMTPPTFGHRVLRDAALSLAIRHDFARPFLNPRQSTPYTYADSPLTSFSDADAAFTSGPSIGAPVVNVKLGEDDYLLDHLHDGFNILQFLGTSTSTASLDDLTTEVQLLGVAVNVVTVAQAPDVDAHIRDPNGAVFERYGAADGTCYLCRPDRHVAARWRAVRPEQLASALAKVTGRSGR